MAQCPRCGTELKEEYGMSQCGSCGAFSFIDMEGNAAIAQGGGESDVPQSTGDAEALGGFESPFSVQPFGEAPEGQAEISTEEFQSIDPFAGNSNDLVQSSTQAVIEVEENPAEQTFDPTPSIAETSAEAPQEYGDIFANPSLNGEAHEEAETNDEVVRLGPPDDPLGLSAFASSEISQAKDGPLLFRILISGIDSKEIRDSIREAIEDSRFAWDPAAVLAKMSKGSLTIENLSPVKAMILIGRLKRLPIQLKWEQNAISQVRPTQ